MYRVGEYELHLFNDAISFMDPGGVFGLVPRVLWSRYYGADGRHLIRSANHNLLIRGTGQNILVDTGYGNCLSDRQRERRYIECFDGTQRGLAGLGIAPEAIDIVLLTHLHEDHCTGNFRLAAGGQREPAFPNASYLVQRQEYEDATTPNERTRATYLAENYVPLYEGGQLKLLDGNQDIAPGLQALRTPGHTPGHMSLRIESAGQSAAFLCDMASMAIHFERLAWMTAYDLEPLVTMETKRAWQRWALETDALLFFPHDIDKPAGRLGRGPQGRAIVMPEPSLSAS